MSSPRFSEAIWVLNSDWLSDSILNGVWLYFHMWRILYAKLIWRITFFTCENIAHIEFYLQGLLPKIFAIYIINRGYYTVARRYEFYVRVARTISHEFAALTREILLLPREHKIHIFEPQCNVLFILWRLNKRDARNQFNKSKRRESWRHWTIRLSKGDIRKIRHSGPEWSGVWNLRVV